jgi:D-alanyl-D-alanine endopeptidase (penicillin-binding protein 7)
MHIKRRIIVVMCGCLALVGISAIIQLNEQQPVADPQVRTAGVATDAEIINMDNGVIDGSISTTVTVPVKKTPTGIPGLTARAYLVGNIDTGQIYLEQGGTRVLPVASMSKLVTAFVATDMLPLDTVISISSSTVEVPPDSSNLTVGEHFTLGEILQPLLLNSSNIAAEAIADSKGDRINFLDMMSSYAWEIGMPKSYFADPSGISPQNAASARDLFELSKYLVHSRPDILAITRVPEFRTSTTTEHGGHLFTSTHPFVRDPRFIGGKTGRTQEAGETMMTILKINNEPIVFIILGSSYGAREGDTRILLRELEKKI